MSTRAFHALRLRPSVLVLIAAMAMAATQALAQSKPAANAAKLKLHVPSPDWRDQIIYMVMTDRFADGDASNNDLGFGGFDRQRGDRYQGGDLRGLTSKLDYIQQLGATAVWITPPVRNQWHDPMLGYFGYHGYWAQHFKEVDPHVGTLLDYQRLSDGLHRRGMYLVQDVVVNHVGNYFEYVDAWDPRDPTKHYRGNTASKPTQAPTQWPFTLNDPRKLSHRRAATYHWTPTLIDHADTVAERTHQLSGLDDLNTRNPTVRRALRESYGHWIKAVGVDAFRVDTAFYVEPAFFGDFMHSRDARAPGMHAVAAQTGRRSFLAFGEGFGIDAPHQTKHARRMESYVRGPRGEPRLSSMIAFPLYGTLQGVFARGEPTQHLADRLQSIAAIHERPHWMPTFIDNHDVDRWLAAGDEASMKQAILALMTLPGMPVIYYGTEQGFREARASMFAGGWGSGGRDRFDTQSTLFRNVAAAIALRRSDRLFSRGTPTVLRSSEAGPGVVAWRIDHHDARQPSKRRSALVVFNTAEHAVMVDSLALHQGLDRSASGALMLQPKHGIPDTPPAQVTDKEGIVSLRMPARSAGVWLLETTSTHRSKGDAVALDELPHGHALPALGDFDIKGAAAPGQRVQVMVDGNLDAATIVQADAAGRWAANVATSTMTDPSVRHRLVAVAADDLDAAPSQARLFRVALPRRVLADASDPLGDDTGPEGRYQYPTHPSFKRGLLDIEHVQVAAVGHALEVTLRMHVLSSVWNPPNGFDHVAVTGFLELANQPGGRRDMPGQDATLPDGMRWHLHWRASGWAQALFAADASAERNDQTQPRLEGRPVVPGLRVHVDATTRTIRLMLPATALPRGASLSGARLYVSTWDYDSGFRPLEREAAAYTFGGLAPSGEPAPKVMDAVGPLRLP